MLPAEFLVVWKPMALQCSEIPASPYFLGCTYYLRRAVHLGGIKKFDWLALYTPFKKFHHSNVLDSLRHFSTNLSMLSAAEGSVCGLPTSVQSTLKKFHTRV